MSYEVGSLYRTTLAVRDANGNLTDPATQVLTVTLPDQTTGTPSIVHDSTGNFHVDYAFPMEGLYRLTWTTTGPVTQRTDYVNAAMWRSILGIDETKVFINDSDADKDPILRQILSAALEEAEKIVGVCVPRRFVDERIPGSEKQVLRMPHGPLPDENAVETITSVYPGGPSWTSDQLIVYPDSGTVEVSSLWVPFWYGPWKATYTAGRRVVSESIQLAVKEMVYDMWSIQRPYGANALEPGPEDTARWEQMIASYQIPPHAKALLGGEEQPGFA
jgi:hypothetical protein